MNDVTRKVTEYRTLAVWYLPKRVDHREAVAVYLELCRGNTSCVEPHWSIDEFCAAIVAKFPEIQGCYVMPPFGRYKSALEVISVL